MILKTNKAFQFFLALLCVAIMLAFVPQQADARKGHKSSGKAQTSVNRNRNTNINRNSNRNTNVNVNSNRNRNTNVNVNSNRNTNVNVDVNVDRRHRHRGGFVAGVATAIVIGAIVTSLPPSGCTTVISNGISYSQCGNTWYQPQYSGNNVTYVVVNAP